MIPLVAIGQAASGLTQGIMGGIAANKQAHNQSVMDAYQLKAQLAAQGQPQQAPAKPAKDNTWIYAGIGLLALIVIVVIIFLIPKKK